jgi:hypothetical protein
LSRIKHLSLPLIQSLMKIVIMSVIHICVWLDRNVWLGYSHYLLPLMRARDS